MRLADPLRRSQYASSLVVWGQNCPHYGINIWAWRIHLEDHNMPVQHQFGVKIVPINIWAWLIHLEDHNMPVHWSFGVKIIFINIWAWLIHLEDHNMPVQHQFGGKIVPIIALIYEPGWST